MAGDLKLKFRFEIEFEFEFKLEGFSKCERKNLVPEPEGKQRFFPSADNDKLTQIPLQYK